MHRFIANSLLVSFSFLLSLAVHLAATDADASQVDKVTATQALVTFDGGEQPVPGDKFFALANGKKRAILEVVQFKNGKAKVKILKGKPAVGMTLALAKGKSKTQAGGSGADGESADKNDHTRSAGAATLFKDLTIGIVAGYSLDSQAVTPVGQIARSMTGSGFSAKAFADVPVTGSLSLLARFGGEQFNVASDTVKTEILYGVADLLLKYSFTEGGLVPFAMGGLGIHFPFSKSSDVLNQNNISPTTVFYGGGGVNYVLGGSSYLQLTAEYGMFPPSNEVTTSLIAVRGGMGFRF